MLRGTTVAALHTEGSQQFTDLHVGPFQAAKLTGIMPRSQGEQCIRDEAQQHGYSASKVQQEEE